MRLLPKVLIWILISFILQWTVLAFLSKKYEARDQISIETVKISENQSLRIPHGALDIKVSFDRKYVAMRTGEDFRIMEIETGQELYRLNNLHQVSFYRWLPDRNMMILSKVNKGSSLQTIEVETFDAASLDIRRYQPIKNQSGKFEITGIQLSSLTNMVYLQLKTNPYEMDVFKYDIMDNPKYVMTTGLETVMKQLNFFDTIVFQKDSKSLWLRNGKENKAKKISLPAESLLLETDYEDRVYLGIWDEKKKIKEIIYQRFTETFNEPWTQVEFPTSLLPQDIRITYKGNIYGVSGEIIYNGKTGRETRFKGSFVDIIDPYIVSIYQGELQFEKINLLE